MVRSKRVKARRGGSSSSSSLFCFCRKKEEGFMIFCDTCEDWFHVACVGLTEREAKKLDSYHCPDCKGKPQKRTVTRSGRVVQQQKISDDDLSLDSDSDFDPEDGRVNSEQVAQDEQEEEEIISEEEIPLGRLRPRKKQSSPLIESGSDDNSEEDNPPPRRKRPTKTNKNLSFPSSSEEGSTYGSDVSSVEEKDPLPSRTRKPPLPKPHKISLPPSPSLAFEGSTYDSETSSEDEKSLPPFSSSPPPTPVSMSASSITRRASYQSKQKEKEKKKKQKRIDFSIGSSSEEEEAPCVEICNKGSFFGDSEWENLDPITGEKFTLPHPHHPYVISPDGKTVICYNESTLRKVAEIRGEWMQPPHFRTAMEEKLKKKCERIGGPLCPEKKEPDDDASGFDFVHRENQLIENFVGRVSQSHVIVCPLCYERLRDDFIGDFGGRASADPDPISVILSRDISSVTSYMFRTRKLWSDHIRKQHPSLRGKGLSTEDFRLKQIIYSWLASGSMETCYYKNEDEVDFKAWDKNVGKRIWKTAQKSQISISLYWWADAYYNSSLYNHIVDLIEQEPVGEPLFEASEASSGEDNWIVGDDYVSPSQNDYVESDGEERRRKKRKGHHRRHRKIEESEEEPEPEEEEEEEDDEEEEEEEEEGEGVKKKKGPSYLFKLLDDMEEYDLQQEQEIFENRTTNKKRKRGHHEEGERGGGGEWEEVSPKRRRQDDARLKREEALAALKRARIAKEKAAKAEVVKDEDQDEDSDDLDLLLHEDFESKQPDIIFDEESQPEICFLAPENNEDDSPGSPTQRRSHRVIQPSSQSMKKQKALELLKRAQSGEGKKGCLFEINSSSESDTPYSDSDNDSPPPPPTPSSHRYIRLLSSPLDSPQASLQNNNDKVAFSAPKNLQNPTPGALSSYFPRQPPPSSSPSPSPSYSTPSSSFSTTPLSSPLKSRFASHGRSGGFGERSSSHNVHFYPNISPNKQQKQQLQRTPPKSPPVVIELS